VTSPDFLAFLENSRATQTNLIVAALLGQACPRAEEKKFLMSSPNQAL